ncbi:MAG: hypothetical protein ACREP5_14570 [Candidatus Binatia bacterium]
MVENHRSIGQCPCSAATSIPSCARTSPKKWFSSRGRDLELRYFRDTDGRETDFVVVERRQPQMFVECKWGDADVDRGLRYLKARFPKVEAWQVSATGGKDYLTPEGIRVTPAPALLDRLI